MSEKLLAGLVTAAVITPLCAVCVLGPAVIASIFAGITGWLGGFSTILTTGLILAGGFAVYRFASRRESRCTSTEPTRAVKQ